MKTKRTPRTILAVGASVLATVAMTATAVAAPGGTGAPTGNDGGTGAVTAAPAPAPAPPAAAQQVVPQINQAVQPLRTQAPATPQYTPVSEPQEVVIDNRPVIVQEVVVQEVTVQETSPGLLILNPEVQRDINPIDVWNKIDSNTKGEDRQTLALAAGAGAAGAVAGGAGGAVVGAVGTGVTGAAAGAIAGGAASGGAVAPLCAIGGIITGGAAGVPCVITAAATGAVAGAAVGGAAGIGAGAVAGGTAGAVGGAAAAANSVPNARTAAQRVAGDVIWELEDEARVKNGYEPLVGEKPSENLDYNEPGSENLEYIPEDVSLNPETAVQQVVNQAVEDYQPVVPPAPQLPEQVPNAQQFNDTANNIQQDVQTNVTNGYNAFKNDVNNAQAAAANIQNDILSAQDAVPSFPSL